MDKAAFYKSLRRRNSGVFGTSLSQRQVDGVESILGAGNHLPLAHLAHTLAQVYRETGGGMYPVKETVYRSSKNQNPTDAQVIARLDRAWAKGQLPWVKSPYWRDGAFGRSQIQITHWDNYIKLSPHVGVDLRKNPDKALDPSISAKIAVKGCELGLFTGERLADFDRPDGYDHGDARSIVNGDERKRLKDGRTIAEQLQGWGEAFEQALSAAEYAPRVDPAPKAPPATEVPAQGLWAALMAALRTIGDAIVRRKT
ncbi:hypothetical protein [uncultured Roseobacter sp.]|uniref:hypothetical protein n=1 Tax=uncultured Roseobacter sp. TaxID=114847 RepID=UPI00261D616F|nr:hypothetical protein [uncultured Roseobacter sp.]